MSIHTYADSVRSTCNQCRRTGYNVLNEKLCSLRTGTLSMHILYTSNSAVQVKTNINNMHMRQVTEYIHYTTILLYYQKPTGCDGNKFEDVKYFSSSHAYQDENSVKK